MLKNFTLTPPVAIIICGVLIAAAIVFVNRYPGAAAAGGTDQYRQVDVPAPTAADHVYGSRSAKIFLIQYSDFQCIFCARAYATMKRLVDESNGEVAWVYRHFPLESIHPEARGAAIASECIAKELGESAFWTFTDLMFTNEGTNQKFMSPQYYSSIGGELGINPIAYNNCIASGDYDDQLERQTGEAYSAGGSGTPFTVVSGGGKQVPISGALPYQQFSAVIQALKARQ